MHNEIKQQRLKRYWSKNRLAREAGLDWGTIDDAESGLTTPREITVIRIQEAFERHPIEEAVSA